MYRRNRIIDLRNQPVGTTFGSKPIVTVTNGAPPIKCRHELEPTGEVFPPPDGVGDVFSNALTAAGITKERWASLLNNFRSEEKQEKSCSGCSRLQGLMNWAGEKLKMPAGKGSKIQELVILDNLREQPVCGCQLYGSCIKLMGVSEEASDTIKSELGHANCAACFEREPVLTISN